MERWREADSDACPEPIAEPISPPGTLGTRSPSAASFKTSWPFTNGAFDIEHSSKHERPQIGELSKSLENPQSAVEGIETCDNLKVSSASRFVEYFEYSSSSSSDFDYDLESVTRESRVSSLTELSTILEESEAGSSQSSIVEKGSRSSSLESASCDLNTSTPPTPHEALYSHPRGLEARSAHSGSAIELKHLDAYPGRTSRSRKGSEEIPPSAVVVFEEESKPNTIPRNRDGSAEPTRSALKRELSLPELKRPVIVESQRSLSDPGLHLGPLSFAEIAPLDSFPQRLPPYHLSSFTFGRKPEEVEAVARGQLRALSIVSPTSEHPPRLEEQTECVVVKRPKAIQVRAIVQRLTPIRRARLESVSMYTMLTKLLDKINVPVGRGSWRAIEWCDFEATPACIRRCCQNMLQKQWTHRIPFIQKQSPASTASSHLQTVINKVADAPGAPRLTVVDFCAGGGGPTPIFEQMINDERKKKGSTPLEFRLCDLYPNTGAWEGFSKRSEHLSYIAASVDARFPPQEVKSMPTPRKALRFTSKTHTKSRLETRIFRLFNLSFHHFDDATAQSVLRSTLTSSDGFAIIELQDRRLGCLAMFFFNVLTSLILTPLWFPFRRNKTQYALTYSGILPFVLWWDGLASCLRTRGFDDFLEIVRRTDKGVVMEEVASGEGGEERRLARWGEWTFENRRELHTFPFGYVSWITGTRSMGRVDSVVLTRERLGGVRGKGRVE